MTSTAAAAAGGPSPAEEREEQEANETPSPSPTSSEPRDSVSSMAGSYAGDGPSAGLQSLLFAFARTFLCLFPTYLAGYLGMSFSWILLGVIVWLGYKRIRASKKQLLLKGEQLSSFEELCIRSGIKHQDLPAWVQFPDVERVEWLNKVLVQVWPFFGRYMEGVFRQAIEPAVRGSTDYLKTFTFTKLHFGEKPFKVTGIKTYSQNVDKRQIILDLQISYVGDCDINVEIPKYFCNAGAKQVQLHGSLRVILEPLISQVPFFGALTFFFIRRPQLNINWTGLTNLLDIPGLNNMSDSMITDQIANLMVLPNRFTVPIVGDLELAELRFPIPKGVLRIHLKGARDLERKDNLLKGMIKGKSDPYTVLHVGPQRFQSKTIQKNLDPIWNEVYEAIVHEVPGQELEATLFDEDPDKDDFLGSLTIDLNEVAKERVVDEWFVLDEVDTGQLHLKLEWLSLLTDASSLNEILGSIRAGPGQANDGLSSALLVVYLDCARNLPSVFAGTLGCGYLQGRRASGLVFCENTSSMSQALFRNLFEFEFNVSKKPSAHMSVKPKKKGTNLEPSPFVQLSVSHTTFESKICYNTNDPVWEQPFTFCIHNPTDQDLDIEVKDDDRQCSLGSFNLPLKRLLAADGMTLDQAFQLSNSGPNSVIKMKLALRVGILKVMPKEENFIQDGQNLVRKKVGKPRGKKKKDSTGAGPKANGMGRTVAGGAGGSHSSLITDKGGEGPHAQEGPSPGLHAATKLAAGPGKEPTPSIASDMSVPASTQELRRRVRQLQDETGVGESPLGQIQLTIRHSAQRNQLVVVVHACKNLLTATHEGANVYVRIYMHPNRRRLGKRKTSTVKKSINPVFDETLEFTMTLAEAKEKHILDLAVKHDGGFLAKEELLGKLQVDVQSLDLTKGTTNWYDLTVDGDILKNK
ncbi:unnamed protein product [Lampetra planeri]